LTGAYKLAICYSVVHNEGCDAAMTRQTSTQTVQHVWINHDWINPDSDLLDETLGIAARAARAGSCRYGCGVLS